MNLFSCSWVHAKMKTSSIFWQEIPTKAPHLILEQIDHMQETMLLYEHLCCSSVSCRNTFISSNTHSGRPETPPDCPHPFFFHTQLCLLLYMIISLNTGQEVHGCQTTSSKHYLEAIAEMLYTSPFFSCCWMVIQIVCFLWETE